MNAASVNSRMNFFQRIHNKYDENSLVRSFLSVLELFEEKDVLHTLQFIFSDNKNTALSEATDISSVYVFDHLWDTGITKFRGIPDFGIMFETNVGHITVFCEAKRGKNYHTVTQLRKYIEKISKQENCFLIGLADHKKLNSEIKSLKKDYPNKLLFINWDTLFNFLKTNHISTKDKYHFLLNELFEYKEYGNDPSQVLFNQYFLDSLRSFKENKFNGKNRVAYKGNIFENSIRGFVKILSKKIESENDNVHIKEIVSSEKNPQHLYKAYFEIPVSVSTIKNIKFQFNIHSGDKNHRKSFDMIKEKFAFYICLDKGNLKTINTIIKLCEKHIKLKHNISYTSASNKKATEALIYFEKDQILWSDPEKMLNDYSIIASELIDIANNWEFKVSQLK